ncbi:MAG: cation transporter [Bacteroidales bacterium]|nr:cation transporter [Bacteroidales bacterium]
MGHDHHHHHHHLESITSDLKKIYIAAIILNALFVAFEAWMGFHSDSLSLVSDAGHKLVDVFSLCLTLLAFILAGSRPGKRFTFGYRKLTVIISLVNAIFVAIVAGTIIYESIEKMMDPSALSPDGEAISITAGVGIIINALSVFLLSYKRRHDVNTRGAFLHMLTDCLLSIGVVIAGFIIKWTGFVLLDPIVGLCIAGFILANILSVLVESFKMSIDAVPEGIDVAKIEEDMVSVPGVKDVSDLHIWPVSTTETALTAKMYIDAGAGQTEIVRQVKERVKAAGIQDSTIEVILPE